MEDVSTDLSTGVAMQEPESASPIDLGDLAPAKQEEAEEQETKETEPEEDFRAKFMKNPLGTISQLPGAPNSEQIEKWKAEYGNVYVADFEVEQGRMILFRAIRRSEFTEMQGMLARGELDPNKDDDYLVKTCALWASFPVNDSCPAGIISTLAKQIAFKSCFYDPNIALALVAQL